ncbi:MAG: hypothetical protein GF330_02965 [Candidatus Eisenbacteria bacterium]|nr:hypothetical protein [Candidatus Eisenbacteria bacterium]
MTKRRRVPGLLLILLLPVAIAIVSQTVWRQSPTRRVTARPISLSDPRRAAAAGDEIPSPTEIARWKGDRRERREERRAWFEELHWAPPDVDWRAIEAANRRAHALERFARLRRGERTEQWTELGSVDQAGRTHAAHPSSDGQQLYVGSNLGGVWRGTIDGQAWTPLSDGLGLGSHGLLVVPPGDGPDEPEMLLTLTTPGPGQGGDPTVYTSADGGQTWFVPAGLPDYLYEAVRLVHDAQRPRTVYLLSRGGQWVENEYVAGWLVSRSTDGGRSFALGYAQASHQPRCDLWIDRIAGGALYLMSGATLLVSTDQGESFTEVGSAACVAEDVILTASEAGAPTFYAALHDGAGWQLYRSPDGGTSWSWRHAISDFWETLLASITDPDLVFFAGVECWRSTDGGASFTKVNNWWDYYGDPENRLHADLPGMDAHMRGGQEVIYFNTDGGTYASYDGGASVENLSLWGLGISQYYSTFTSANHPYLIAAGSQDQGYQQSTPALRNGYLPFDQLISGDYGHLTSATRDHDWLYSVYPGFVLLQVQETPPQGLFQIDFPDCNHSWMPPILADPLDADVFYLCGDHLWRYERNAPGYTYTMSELPQAFGSSYASALAISPADPDYWYVATNTGLLWYSHDGGQSWAQSEDQGPAQHYFYGTALAATASDPLRAYVGGSGYAGNAVWRTLDGGVHWEPFGAGLPNTLCYGLAVGGEDGETLFAACEAGPYMYDDEAGVWVSVLGTEAPLTLYWCVEWVPEIGVARFGTYGRGIWDFDPRDPARVAEGEERRATLALACTPTLARDRVTVTFTLPRAAEVRLELFDVTGRRRARLAGGRWNAGSHAVTVDPPALRLETGFYLVRLITERGVAVRKFQRVE